MQELAGLKALQMADAKRAVDGLKAKCDELEASRAKADSKPNASVQKPSSNTATRPAQSPSTSPANTKSRSAARSAQRDYAQWQEGATSYDYTERCRTTRYYLPSKVMDFFDNEFDYTSVRNWDDLIAVRLGGISEPVCDKSAAVVRHF